MNDQNITYLSLEIQLIREKKMDKIDEKYLEQSKR